VLRARTLEDNQAIVQKMDQVPEPEWSVSTGTSAGPDELALSGSRRMEVSGATMSKNASMTDAVIGRSEVRGGDSRCWIL